MKKVISIFLLGIFVFNTMGYFIAFKAIQFQIKSEMKSQIEGGISIPYLTKITVSKAELKNLKTEGDGEIKYNDEFYDVVSKIETATSTTFYCLNDNKESQLFSYLNKQVDNQLSSKPIKNDAGKNLVNNVLKLFFSVDKVIIKSNSITEFLLLPFNHSGYNSLEIPTTTPPPEFA